MKKKAQDIKDLIDIEFAMMENLKRMGFGFNTQEDKFYLVELETQKRTILCDREKEARQKRRVLWLLCGDDNTPFFHKYVAYRKNLNSIWKIEDDYCNLVEGFEDIAMAGCIILILRFRKNLIYIFLKLFRVLVIFLHLFLWMTIVI